MGLYIALYRYNVKTLFIQPSNVAINRLAEERSDEDSPS